MAGDSPERFVATITKSKRRRKILVDYLRNGRRLDGRGSYSTRPQRARRYRLPLAWDELGGAWVLPISLSTTA